MVEKNPENIKLFNVNRKEELSVNLKIGNTFI